MFLNTDYDEYVLADSNPDLINLYQQLVGEKEEFIKYCKPFFKPSNNSEDRYYELRDEFNNTANKKRKSAIFLYLNKHCYNGLCRYNRRGKFNSPFGLYKKPNLPEKRMKEFIQAAKNTTLLNSTFVDTMKMARKGDVIYCDPPYAPLSKTSYFTDYHSGGFNWEDQTLLAETAEKLSGKGIKVVISNHKTKEICKLYKDAGAKITSFKVQRHISRDGKNRNKVDEILAVFN